MLTRARKLGTALSAPHGQDSKCDAGDVPSINRMMKDYEESERRMFAEFRRAHFALHAFPRKWREVLCQLLASLTRRAKSATVVP